MGNLEAAINDSAKVIRVSALTPPLSGALLRIEDELLAFRSVKRLDTPPFRPNEDGDWNVDRGVAGTTAASHAEDSEVVYAYPVYGDEPIGGGGGGLPAGVSLTVEDFSPRMTEGVVLASDDALDAGIAAGTVAAGEAYGYVQAQVANGPGAILSAVAAMDANYANAAVYGNTGTFEVYASLGIVLSIDAGNIIVTGLPSTDPGVAGALYTAGAPGADDPKALMVSGGTAP